MSRSLVLFLLSLTLLGGMAEAQDSLNVIQMGQLALAGEAWHVAISGNYACVAAYGAGLRVVDISNPAVPVEVGSCPTPSLARYVAISGIYAYVADADSGLRIIDISTPSRPFTVGGHPLGGDTWCVAVSGSYAYVTDQISGLHILDITNPLVPMQVGNHLTPGTRRGVAIAGFTAYIADGPGGLRILDVINPSAPVELGNWPNTPPGYSFKVAISGSLAYIAQGGAGLRIVDVANPSSPAEIGHYQYEWPLAWDVAIAGSYAYLAYSFAGLRVVDITDPTAPVEAGYYDANGTSHGVAVSESLTFLADGAYFRIFQFTPQNLTVTLTPHNPPIIIPATGGSFRYDLEIENLSTSPIAIDIWIMATLPGGTNYLILLRPAVTLPGGASIIRNNLSQNVPGSAPSGNYAYSAVVGDFPEVVMASDTIYFEKLSGRSSIGCRENWDITGWQDEPGASTMNRSDPVRMVVSPNPFNPTTVLSYQLPAASRVSLRIYDTAGRLVETLVHGWREAGNHSITFDGSNLPSGIYFAKLAAGDYSRGQKIVLLK